MKILSLWHKLPELLRTILITVVVGTIIYSAGYCSGNEHGSSSQKVKQLEIQGDSLEKNIKKMQIEGVEKDLKINKAIDEAIKSIQAREALKAVTHVVAPGKVQVIVQGEPKVVPIPVEVTELLAADSLTIAEVQAALVLTQERIENLKQQVIAEHDRAEVNWRLYKTAKKMKHGHGSFIFGMITGLVLATGSILIAK